MVGCEAANSTKLRNSVKRRSQLQTMANYDPVAALDLEKRLGIEKGDIDDFLRKVVSQLLDFTIVSTTIPAVFIVALSQSLLLGVTTIFLTHAQLAFPPH